MKHKLNWTMHRDRLIALSRWGTETLTLMEGKEGEWQAYSDRQLVAVGRFEDCLKAINKYALDNGNRQ